MKNDLKAETIYDKPICQSCGEEFSCGAKTGNCWCFQISLEAEILKDLQKKYKNCLCRNCLKNKMELSLSGQTPTENQGFLIKN